MITLDLLADLSALAYLVVLLLAAFDVIVPVLPSESVVILGGVLAWQGRLHPVPLVLAAAAGAIAGDHMSYGIGRWTQRGRPQPGRRGGERRMGKAERLQVWAGRQLERRGPVLLQRAASASVVSFALIAAMIVRMIAPRPTTSNSRKPTRIIIRTTQMSTAMLTVI